MPKGKRTTLIENLWADEIKYLAYEIYRGADTIPHIRTYAILNDEFNTLIKLEELGQIDKNIIDELKKDGYKLLEKNHSLKLKKTA